ncbi:MAG TPA: bifunctional oligoribonuclease/PAP phosphatase NrnA [Bacillota bacterium]|nr:bifunctional oligoribonuclease/PAP phosphatase NrnA [Bacillota bacterium]
MTAPGKVIEAVKSARSVFITTHVVPDGDAIGSLLGMKLALERLGKQCEAGLSDPVPPSLRFLPGSDGIRSGECGNVGRHDLALVLDCGSLDRVGQCAAKVESCPVSVNIDHHSTNTRFAAINWVDTEAAATCQLVAELIAVMGVAYDSDIATCLFAGLSTDTGSFRYSNTRASTFRIAAELADAGARPWEIAQNVYDSRPYSSLAALAEAILGIEFCCGRLIASMVITAADMARHGITEGDTEGFIGYARSIDGVEVAVALREVGPETIRVGLRSKQCVDVASVASEFGGGGHVRASGCTIQGTMDEARSKLMPSLERALREAGYTWTA